MVGHEADMPALPISVAARVKLRASTRRNNALAPRGWLMAYGLHEATTGLLRAPQLWRSLWEDNTGD